MDKLINFQALSLLVTGKKDTLRPKKIPKKYKTKVSKLFELLEYWNNDKDLMAISKHNDLKEELKNVINKY
jgi:hypothetical protein